MVARDDDKNDSQRYSRNRLKPVRLSLNNIVVLFSSKAEEYSGQNFLPELVESSKVIRRNRVIFDHRTKWNYGSFKLFDESPFIECFPTRQEILYFSQIVVTLPGIRPPFFIQA